MSSKHYYKLSGSVHRHSRQSKVDGMFAWTIFIFLLIGFTLFCWMGSFYIFGHPEKASNYKLLKRLHKLEDPQRFEMPNAPRGEFLKPAKLLEQFNSMTQQEIKRTNESLLRNFLRNYHQTHDLVPYAQGTYQVLKTFPLSEKTFVHSGIAAILQSIEQPEILLEQIFPTTPENLPSLRKALQPGQTIKLDKPLDLSAVIFITRLKDRHIKLTTMPLLYSTYGKKQEGNAFSLEPPTDLDLSAGPPVLTKKEVSELEESLSLRKGKINSTPPPEAKEQKETPVVSTPLTRIASLSPTTTSSPSQEQGAKKEIDSLKESSPAEALANTTSESPSGNTLSVLPAIPVTASGQPTTPKVLPATPVGSTSSTSNLIPRAAPVATPATTPSMITNTPVTPLANTTGGVWPLYDAGKMPRGRIIDEAQITPLAEQGTEGERLYLQGNFSVTASGQDRAVLRYAPGNSSLPLSQAGKIRIIVSYPIGITPPAEGTSVTRDQQRPFMITDTKKEPDGTINLYVREITRP